LPEMQTTGAGATDMNQKQIEALTGNDLLEIIRHWHESIIIYCGAVDMACVTPEIDSVHMNGEAVQINTNDINFWNEYGHPKSNKASK